MGQEHIATTLTNALKNDRLPQALLFTGVRGTGKTSAARILAKSLRCTNAKDFVPCGVCKECEDIASSRSLDVIEIDGASNNGVDAVRELRDTVTYMPSSGRYKIYIIDEVHMLSTSAFNALLKTLEEPPAHVVFVLATTEVQKIPNTILSRCQRFDFRRIPTRLIAKHLEYICKTDGIPAETEALWLIARQGDGSMRDSQSLLDQCITYGGGKLSHAAVIEGLGLTDRSLLIRALRGIAARDIQATSEVVRDQLVAGTDARIFAQELLEEIRHTLFIRLLGDADLSSLVDLPDSEIEELREIAQNLTDSDLHQLFDMTLKGTADISRSSDPRLVLEVLLLRLASAPRLRSLEQLGALGKTTPRFASRMASAPDPVQKSVSAPASVSGPQGPVSASPTPTQAATQTSADASAASASAPASEGYTMDSFIRIADPNAAPGTPGSGISRNRIGLQPPPAPAPSAASTASAPADPEEESVNLENSPDPWVRFVAKVKKQNGLLGAMLENTHILQKTEDAITIGVPPKMDFFVDKLKAEDNVKKIEQFIQDIMNETLKVNITLAEQKASAPKTVKNIVDEKRAEQKKSVEDQVEQNPFVQTARNLFKSQIKQIKDIKPERTK